MTSRTPGSENQAIEVFFSYAHEDEELRDELAKHLKLLERQKVISAWYDRDISAGDDWKQEIEQRLNSADVILLLISADFLASDFCWGVELDRAMERHETVQARVIPIILREVDWKGAPFGKLQALPKNAEPVTNWANRDQAFADIARGIRQVVKELQEPEELEKPVSPSPKLGETQRSQETTSPSPKPPTVLPEKRLQASDRQRLADLEELLELLYEKLGSFERELIVTASTPAKFELRQRIKREILPSIRRYEAEYWELYPREAVVISDEEAETQLAKVEQAVESIERIPSTEYPPELVPLLQDIRAKLEESDKAASAKLKVALPLIPAIASYELEMDTEEIMYKVWKSIKRLVRR